jgi:uncharacterized protein (TIGR02646 family)
VQYINKDRVQARLPANWNDYVERCWQSVNDKIEAAKAIAVVDGLTAEEIEKEISKVRKAAIAKRAALWRLFAKHVSTVNNNKCWYCESKENRSRMPVDHFRPKASVDNCDGHDGYWWLAFDWENYRYCCTLCNSLTADPNGTHGKADKFPLLNENDRCSDEACDLENERPVLLDPFKSRDVRLLTFLENGIPAPNADKGTDDYKRADDTIKIVNLHEGKIRVSRLRIAAQIKRIMKKINSLLEKQKNGENVDDDLEIFENQLSVYLDEEAAYRTAAKVYFKGHRSEENSDWYDDFSARI